MRTILFGGALSLLHRWRLRRTDKRVVRATLGALCAALGIVGATPRASYAVWRIAYIAKCGLIAACVMLLFASIAANARAAITIENSTTAAVNCRIAVAGQRAPLAISLSGGDTQSLDLPQVVDCTFSDSQQTVRYKLEPGGRYRFITSAAGKVELRTVPAANAAPQTAAPTGNQPAVNRSPRPQIDFPQAPARPPEGWAHVREVKVLVAGGSEYRAFYNGDWQPRARQIVEAASRRFEDQFPIRFRVVGFRPWEYKRAPQTAGDAFEWLHKIDRGDADLVIGFTMVPFPGPRGEIRGVSQYFSQYVVIPDGWGTTGATTRLVHELGHVFGAFHVAAPDSVMQLGFERTPRTFRFGEPAEKMIALTKDVDLKEGVDSLPSETQDKIRALYRANHHPLEGVDEDPIVSGYRYQARRAGWVGDTERQERMQAIADRLQPPKPEEPANMAPAPQRPDRTKR